MCGEYRQNEMHIAAPRWSPYGVDRNGQPLAVQPADEKARDEELMNSEGVHVSPMPASIQRQIDRIIDSNIVEKSMTVVASILYVVIGTGSLAGAVIYWMSQQQ